MISLLTETQDVSSVTDMDLGKLLQLIDITCGLPRSCVSGRMA
jgi:hypothetical protein